MIVFFRGENAKNRVGDSVGEGVGVGADGCELKRVWGKISTNNQQPSQTKRAFKI